MIEPLVLNNNFENTLHLTVTCEIYSYIIYIFLSEIFLKQSSNLEVQ